MTDRTRLFLVLLVLNLGWAPTNFVVQAAQTSLGAGGVAVVRWPLFALAMWGLLALPSFRSVEPPAKLRWASIAIGVLLVGPSHLLYGLGIGQSTGTETTILNLSAPLFTAALAVFILREVVSATRWTAIFIALAGTYLVSVGFQLPAIDALHTKGNLVYLCGTLLECTASVLMIKIVRASSGLGALKWEVTGAGLGVLVFGLLFAGVFDVHLGSMTPMTILPIAYLVLIAGVFCFGGWYREVERAPITLMMLTLALQAPASMLIGWFWRHEALNSAAWFGFGLILIALVVGMPRSSRITATEAA